MRDMYERGFDAGYSDAINACFRERTPAPAFDTVEEQMDYEGGYDHGWRSVD